MFEFDITQLWGDPSYDFYKKLGLALMIGVLIGIERERGSDRKVIFAGVRTFTIVCLTGMLSAFISAYAGKELLIVTTLFFTIIVAMLVYIKNVVYKEIGTTGTLALFYTYFLGIFIAYGFYTYSIVGAIVLMFLLVEKRALHTIAYKLTQEEVVNAVQFLVVAFIFYPITPDMPLLGVLNPKLVLKVVILVSAISFVSFILLKEFGTQKGTPLVGLLGGLVNSEATTGALAAMAKKDTNLANSSHAGIVLSNTSMLLRNLVIAYIVSPAVMFLMAPPQVVLAASNILSIRNGKNNHSAGEPDEPIGIQSPFALVPAFKFAFGFTILSLVASFVYDRTGTAGIYVLALGGLISSAAVTASMAAIALSDPSLTVTAALTAVLAGIISTANKMVLVRMAGPAELSRNVNRTFISLILLSIVVFAAWALYILSPVKLLP